MTTDLRTGEPTVIFATTNQAIFSDDEVYRWLLTRELGGKRTLGVIGLNPSIANLERNDPTVRREIGFAEYWGCGRLVKTNAYGFIATDPKVMKRAAKAGTDVVGVDNDMHIRRMIAEVQLTDGILLVAWGRNIDPIREREIALILRFSHATPMCLGIDKHDGSAYPQHPLYLPYERELRPWDVEAAARRSVKPSKPRRQRRAA